MRRFILFAFALLVVDCSHAPAPKAGWDGPAEAVRVVSYNVYKLSRGPGPIKAEIERFEPDFVFLQELLVQDAESFPRELNMAAAFEAHRNFPQEGIAILSRYPLENVRPLIDEEGRTFALLADTTVRGKSFMVGCVHLRATMRAGELLTAPPIRQRQIDAIVNAWKAAGSPPAIIGGDFNQGSPGDMTKSFIDGLRQLDADQWTCDAVMRMRLDYLFTSPEWRPIEGGTGEAGLSDHRPIWMSVMPAK